MLKVLARRAAIARQDCQKITQWGMIRLTEGDLSPVSCTDSNYDCPKMQDCVTIRIWKELDEAINSVIDKYTLEDLFRLAGCQGQ